MRLALECGMLSEAVCPPQGGQHPNPRGPEQNKGEGGKVNPFCLTAELGRGSPALRQGLNTFGSPGSQAFALGPNCTWDLQGLQFSEGRSRDFSASIMT